MPSTPIAIAAAHVNHGVASPASSFSSLSSGLYVPVHKRRRSSMSRTDDSLSSFSSSSRPLSRADSYTESEYDHHYNARVYSREQLLALAKSPSAVMSKEVKDGLRETVPEIVMSRKHRKAMEYRARTTATHQNAKTAEPQQQQHQTNLKKLVPEQRLPVNVATQPRHQLHEPYALPHHYQEKRWSVSTRPDATGGMNWRRTAAPPSISVA